MPRLLAYAIEIFTASMTVAAMGYFAVATLAARMFLFQRRARAVAFTPPVSILKSLKGIDPGMMDAFRSHCRQSYAGEYELLFGISSADDPAAAAVHELQREFPALSIQLIVCPERLGTNGKVSTLVQMLPHARHDYLLINDSDITVSPLYLERVMALFRPNDHQTPPKSGPSAGVGMVTALYRGRAHKTLPSHLEALGISTDFMAGVLVSRMFEGGLRFGMGSTLAIPREVLDKIGGLAPLLDHLADDYELGVRVFAAGYRIALCPEAVQTDIAPYSWRGFVEHQLRWARTVRDARPGGYAGLIVTHGLPWALLNVLASGVSLLSLWLLALCFFLRIAMAMTLGAAVLGDHQVLADLWLLPLRDLVWMGLWTAGYASNTIVWRGERFLVHHGTLRKEEET